MTTSVPECTAAPFGDTALAPTQRISKEERISYRDETSSDAQIPLYDKRIINIAKIYTVATESGKYLLEESNPFIHGVALQGPKGEVVRLRGVFDDGATINAIDTKVFALIKHRLSRPRKSDRILRMANGILVPSGGTWVATITVGGVSIDGAFEIFPSGNSWALLFGKPLLQTFDMTHQYKHDTISLEGPSGIVTLSNQFGRTIDSKSAALAGVSMTADIKQRETFGENYCSPLRQVPKTTHPVEQEQNDESLSPLTDIKTTDTSDTVEHGIQKNEGMKKMKGTELPTPTVTTEGNTGAEPSHETTLGDILSPMREVSDPIPTTPETCNIDPATVEPKTRSKYRATVEDITDDDDSTTVYTTTTDIAGVAQPDITNTLDKSIFTRSTHPFKPERVQKIKELVTIGNDLTELERNAVQALISEFADCFALSVSEGKAVKNGEHKLDIKPGVKFSTKINNRPLSPPQRAYLNKALDELLEAGVIRPIAAEDVKCCSPVS